MRYYRYLRPGAADSKSCIFQFCCYVIAATVAISLAGCGGQNDEAGSGSSSKSMPKFDKEATYNGRPLSDYAAGLTDLNPQQRLQALMDIGKFGVNGLGVRDQVAKIALEDEDASLRIVALSILSNMQDPKAPDLFIEIFSNPESSDDNRFWYEMALGANKAIPADRLESVLKKIANRNQEHAERLLNLQPRTPIHVPLAKILSEKKVSAATTGSIMALLPQMDMSDEEKISFIRNNIDSMPNKGAALTAYATIEGDLAFDAIVALLNEDDSIPLQDGLNALAAKSNENTLRAIDVMAEWSTDPGLSDQDRMQIYEKMMYLLEIKRNSAQAGPVEQASFVEVTNAYFSTLGELTRNPSGVVRYLSSRYILKGLIAMKFINNFSYFETFDLESFMQPVFDLLASEQEEIVLGTVLSELGTSIGRFPLDLKWQENRALGVNLYAWLEEDIADGCFARDGEDEWAYAVADGLLKDSYMTINTPPIRMSHMYPLLTARAEEDPGHIANSLVFDWLIAMASNRSLEAILGDQGSVDEVMSSLGTLAMDRAVAQSQVELLFNNRNFSSHSITVNGQNTDAIIAFLDPIAMSQDQKFFGPNVQAQMRTALGANIYYLRGKPDQARYTEWVRKVATNGSPAFRQLAIDGLNQYGP